MKCWKVIKAEKCEMKSVKRNTENKNSQSAFENAQAESFSILIGKMQIIF